MKTEQWEETDATATTASPLPQQRTISQPTQPDLWTVYFVEPISETQVVLVSNHHDYCAIVTMYNEEMTSCIIILFLMKPDDHNPVLLCRDCAGITSCLIRRLVDRVYRVEGRKTWRQSNWT